MKPENYFDLISYMATSAHGCVWEPKLYGPFRLIDAVSRLIGILEEEGIEDQFLSKLKKRIDSEKYSVMTDEEKFINFLDKICIQLATEKKKRR